jgi:hypothetical protein
MSQRSLRATSEAIGGITLGSAMHRKQAPPFKDGDRQARREKDRDRPQESKNGPGSCSPSHRDRRARFAE